MVVRASFEDLVMTKTFTGADAWYLRESIVAAGLDRMRWSARTRWTGRILRASSRPGRTSGRRDRASITFAPSNRPPPSSIVTRLSMPRPCASQRSLEVRDEEFRAQTAGGQLAAAPLVHHVRGRLGHRAAGTRCNRAARVHAGRLDERSDDGCGPATPVTRQPARPPSTSVRRPSTRSLAIVVAGASSARPWSITSRSRTIRRWSELCRHERSRCVAAR